MISEDKVYTVQEVADMFRVTDTTIRNLCRNGKLEHIRIGDSIRITGKQIKDYTHQ